MEPNEPSCSRHGYPYVTECPECLKILGIRGTLKSLITLKDSITIAHLATKLDYKGAKAAVESIIGKVPDLCEVTDEQAMNVIITLSERIKRNESRNKLVQNNTFTPEPSKPKTTKGKSKKKEVMVID